MRTLQAVHRRVQRLIAAKRLPDAIALLISASSATRLRDPATAAHFLACASSFSFGLRKDRQALRLIREAFALTPQDGLHALAVTRQLAHGGAAALRVLRASELALKLLALNPMHHYALPEALGLRGVALSRLGRKREAIEILRSLKGAAQAPARPAHDTNPAIELLSSRATASTARAYLKAIGEDPTRFKAFVQASRSAT